MAETPLIRDEFKDFVIKGEKLFARAICSKCDGTEEIKVPFRCGDRQFQRIFHELHWDTAEDGTLICPNCVFKRRRASFGKGGPLSHFYRKPEGETVGKSPATEPAPMPSRQPNLKEQRLIFAALEEHYRDGAYMNGKSDSLIGAELDVPSEFVKLIRQQAFSPLVSPEYADIRRDLDEAREKLNGCYARLAKLEQAAEQ